MYAEPLGSRAPGSHRTPPPGSASRPAPSDSFESAAAHGLASPIGEPPARPEAIFPFMRLPDLVSYGRGPCLVEDSCVETKSQHVGSSMFVLIPQQDAASYQEPAVANPVSQSHMRLRSVSDLLTSLVFQTCSGGRDVVAAPAAAGAR